MSEILRHCRSATDGNRSEKCQPMPNSAIPIFLLAVGILCTGTNATISNHPIESTHVRTGRHTHSPDPIVTSPATAHPHATSPVDPTPPTRSSAFPLIVFLLLLVVAALIVIRRALKTRPTPEVLDVASLLESEDLY
jgi:hypothetical protein